ncbi:interferon regulatory factor 10 isoform X2 [Myxocyprinus asiaticus]|uniref:interferon regulatory factor 10 isoform X2 n=1 Tax=Myxocyprinus asiaticus TaxID=70543 RepID=UPI00222377F5|nr:interferon regulatory factor 10 isoform X2 [Myxocyprinus asiaticus]
MVLCCRLMEDRSRHMRLREWLIAQIDSGKYAGLSWENQEKTMFRIPWKHAAKQDYRQNQDAALFKAWAMYKGKFQEGRDKADPSTWKTRLRCALNKSTDFQEVPERSQLDISEPYKVYRILEDNGRVIETAGNPLILQDNDSSRALRGTHMPIQVNPLGDSNREIALNGRSYVYPSTGAEVCGSAIPQSVPLYSSRGPLTDCRLEVCLFYHGNLVQSVVTASQDGCFILQGCSPVGNERIYGPCEARKVFFPRPDIVPLPPGISDAMSRLLPHLEKGVLVWVAPDGIFIKRFCQGRVYWDGPLAEHREKPNKLERERTCKLLDMTIFLEAVVSGRFYPLLAHQADWGPGVHHYSPARPFVLHSSLHCLTPGSPASVLQIHKDLQKHQQGTGPEPQYIVDLCFGEEFPDPSQPKTKKLITAQVIPLFAVECLRRPNLSDNMEMKHSPPHRSSVQNDA